MDVILKPSELCKRIAFRYYPILLIFTLPSTYISQPNHFPDLNLSFLFFIGFVGPIYFWLIIILSLNILKPVGFVKRLFVMIAAYLTGVLIQDIGLTLYLNFHHSIFSGSPVSIKFALSCLMGGFFVVGSVILAERSLIFEKTYIAEKTDGWLGDPMPGHPIWLDISNAAIIFYIWQADFLNFTVCE